METRAIFAVFLVVFLLTMAYGLRKCDVEDKYIIRDSCIYHKTAENIGGQLFVNYTLTTCDEKQFNQYKIEND